ncbi:MAG: GxxExxY protein [Flavobacteriaceae bacterium]|jgi:GxxExxY protein|uniref:GxxExxY protein n=1 Tax=Flavobacterium kayseriense TaxID=2764714 RepID=A0ABR7J9W5_9FLAO|nr:GxxExxY protein [Flavobacterium kayseriense]MBC5842256.1 GxxExxY protein [Flavobacterium kayseriense]MBC5848786.1 GxxExxY protein [Flavobacterium kayseriense]MBU0940535.1 GxxExxY protein [Bacteroidota bacterium]MBX9887206.1 GxxExxY protein [Flavobacteriaceae bacterium]
MEEYLYADETYTIIGILFEVHKTLGKGFSEIVYKDALEFEFGINNIPYEREKEYSVNYKNTILKHRFYADFVLYKSIILEVKTVDCFNNSHYNQCLNYLKVSGNELALLVNFNSNSLEYKRIIRTKK